MHLSSWARRWAILGLLAIPFGASAAEDPDKNVTEKVLDILRDQGSITEQQYDELRKEAEDERRAAALPPVSTANDPQAWKAYWKDGFRVERNDGLFKLKFGGRIQFDAAGVGASGGVDRRFDPQGTGVDFRRARFFFQGSFYENGIFKAQYDFTGGDNDFKDVWVGLRKLPHVGRVRAGHMKEATSLEQLTSSKYITFMERALPVAAFGPRRNAGIDFQNTAMDGRMTWQLGFYRQVGDDAENFSDQGDYNISARLTGTPIFEDEGQHVLHLGGWYSHQFAGDEPLRYRTRPEANTASRLVDTGENGIISDGVDLVGLELAMVKGPLSIQGEYIHSFVNGGEGSGSVDFGGSYIEASYFLTGESRTYRPKAGDFGRVKPLKPFSLDSGDCGAVQLAGRWSWLDLTDESVRGGIESNYTLGLNWHLYSNLRLMFNYVLARRHGVGQAHVAQSRVSLDF